EAQVALQAARQQGAPRGGEGQRGQDRLPEGVANGPGRRRIPEPDDPVPVADGDPGAVRGEISGGHLVGGRAEVAQLLAGRRVEEANATVVVLSGEDLAIRGEAEEQGVHGLWEALGVLARGEVELLHHRPVPEVIKGRAGGAEGEGGAGVEL